MPKRRAIAGERAAPRRRRRPARTRRRNRSGRSVPEAPREVEVHERDHEPGPGADQEVVHRDRDQPSRGAVAPPLAARVAVRQHRRQPAQARAAGIAADSAERRADHQPVAVGVEQVEARERPARRRDRAAEHMLPTTPASSAEAKRRYKCVRSRGVRCSVEERLPRRSREQRAGPTPVAKARGVDDARRHDGRAAAPSPRPRSAPRRSCSAVVPSGPPARRRGVPRAPGRRRSAIPRVRRTPRGTRPRPE